MFPLDKKIKNKNKIKQKLFKPKQLSDERRYRYLRSRKLNNDS